LSTLALLGYFGTSCGMNSKSASWFKITYCYRILLLSSYDLWSLVYIHPAWLQWVYFRTNVSVKFWHWWGFMAF